MPQEGRIVGIDVGKAKIDACIRALGLHTVQPSTPEGEAALIDWLRAHAVATAVMEASGGYERRWAAALRAAGIAVRVVDPKRVRHFAKSAGRLAKNDPIDAHMIAWFGEIFADAPTAPEQPEAAAEREELARLVTARAALVKLKTQACNRQEHQWPAIAAQAFDAVVKTIEAQRAALEAEIAAQLAAARALAERAAIVRSIPGLGAIATAGLLAWMPELGRLNKKAAAALLGAAPYDDDSGGRTGERHIKGGRGKLRELLYLPLVGAATRHNPVLNAYYKRLRGQGKPFKSVIIACMRKLIGILNTMLARGQHWNPPAAAVA